MNNSMEKSKINSNYDILKVALAIMIVMIHSEFLPNVLYPWFRISVPLFFIISAYFFFSKIRNCADEIF